MKKIIVLLVGLLAMFSCEQEDLEGIVKSDTGQVQTRATASIADFDPISELANIPVNILNVGNTWLKYLSTAKSGSKIDLFTKDDDSGRQRWYIKINRIVLQKGNKNPAPYLCVYPHGIQFNWDYPILAGVDNLFNANGFWFTCLDGTYYNLSLIVPTTFTHTYMQSRTNSDSDLVFSNNNSTNLALWEIVAVGEYEIVDIDYVYTSEDNLIPIEVVCDRDTYENQSASVVTWDYSLSLDYTETSNFSKTEGVSTSITGGLSVGLPNLLGKDSNIGINTSIQQQTSKSWTFGKSDNRKVSRTRTGHITVQPHTTMGLEATVFMYEGTLTYVATLRKIGDTNTFKAKGKWEGACFSEFKAKTYDVATGKVLNTFSLD